MTRPWNNWFHCIGSTYGVWLRGDPRGWRARHHREHVDGDYKQPPPTGQYDRVHEQSRRLMKRDEVVLDAAQRRVVCLGLAEALQHHHTELVELCMGATHFHGLCRFAEEDTRQGAGPRRGGRGLSGGVQRRVVGLAKNWAAKRLVDAGLFEHVKIWGKRCKVVPIESPGHFKWVARYIREHGVKEGAAVWSVVRGESESAGGDAM